MIDEYGQWQLDGCLYCPNGLHALCHHWIDGRCCCGGLLGRHSEHAYDTGLGAERPSKPVLEPGQVTDSKSTGRKRAAMLAPILDGMVCEWAGLRYAGGGVQPIVGCQWNTLKANTKDGDGADLHHGPDKNTLNNALGVNLFRICKSCHHTWHKANDSYYPTRRPGAGEQWLPGVNYSPHDGFTEATYEELEAANRDREQINARASESQIAQVRHAREATRRALLGAPVDTGPELL